MIETCLQLHLPFFRTCSFTARSLLIVTFPLLGESMNWLYSCWRWLREIGSLRGMYFCSGGSDGAPHGPRWLIQAPWPLLRWVEMKKQFSCKLGESMTWLYCCWRWLRKIGSLREYVLLIGGVWWGPQLAQVVDTGPLATVEMVWDEKIIFMQIRGK